MIRALIRCTNSVREVLLIYALALAAGALSMSYHEGLSIFDGLYWAVTTSTSTGYGDISPKTAVGKLTAMALMLFTILAILPLLVGRVYQVLTEDEHQFTDAEQKEVLRILRKLDTTA